MIRQARPTTLARRAITFRVAPVRVMSTLPSTHATAEALEYDNYTSVGKGLDICVHHRLKRFVEKEVLPGTGVLAAQFWSGLDDIVREIMPANMALLRERDVLQESIDEWHDEWHATARREPQATFLERIGYLVDDAPTALAIRTANVDPEIARVAGPQLVCPVDNGRFVLNAANARWGSLLDAIYGTNALLPAAPARGPYDATRGAQALAAVDTILDELFPLDFGRWEDVVALEVREGALRVTVGAPEGTDGAGGALATTQTCLRSAEIVGYTAVGDGLSEGDETRASNWSVLLKRHGLHAELVYDATVGGGGEEGGEGGVRRGMRAGLVDVRLESALTTICDMEDSACTVDVDDKLNAYRNWLGLMKRDLTCTVRTTGAAARADETTERSLNGPRAWRSPETGRRGAIVLPGQSLLLARNVGLHMLTDSVLTSDGARVPEHLVDALVTAACALHDVAALHGDANGRMTPRNSAHGSVYIVKPKMHGPAEVSLACELFARVEYALGLPHNTLKMGVMDEERRTSANLAAALAPANERLVFVNTGFLDRTADEIHTCMRGGPVHPKSGLKGGWYHAYEHGNVDTCLDAGLVGRGQIGKGMWAEPDDMGAMLASKGAQLDAGASTAWVPSPTAATLHALHYLRTNVAYVQGSLTSARSTGGAEGTSSSSSAQGARRAELLSPPIMTAAEVAALSAAEVQRELDDNVQSLLGYVVRWVGQGVGCSKVPNLAGTPLMEDRATLRISSQFVANWLLHGLVTSPQVDESLRRVAKLVDEQNAGTPGYTPLAPGYDGPEWHAARELIFGGLDAPNGYTEPALTKWRRVRKAMDADF